MAWKIDNLSFSAADKQLYAAEPVEFTRRRTGKDGTAFTTDAYRAETQVITTTVDLPASAAANFRRACKKLERMTPTVVDQFGEFWTVYVNKARCAWFYATDGQITLIVTWSLTPASERP